MNVIDDIGDREEKEMSPEEIYEYLHFPRAYGKFMYVGSGTTVRVVNNGTIRRTIRTRNKEVDEPITFEEFESMCDDWDELPGLILKGEY